MEPTRTEEQVTVRNLRPSDLQQVITLDAKLIGRRREQFFELKLQQNLVESGIKVSLAGEVDGAFCGFLLARVYYGEFGTLEPTAVLDTVGVHPDFRNQGVGKAMMRQLRLNLRGLGVSRLQTEVDWDSLELLRFFQREGFHPAQRFCLDLDLRRPRLDEEPDE